MNLMWGLVQVARAYVTGKGPYGDDRFQKSSSDDSSSSDSCSVVNREEEHVSEDLTGFRTVFGDDNKE